MAALEPKKFKSKDEIKEFLERVSKKAGVERDRLADKLGISTSAFYGYITRREIPQKSYAKLIQMLEGKFQEHPISSEGSDPTKVDLKLISMDELVNEMERRGWIVELKRKAQSTK